MEFQSDAYHCNQLSSCSVKTEELLGRKTQSASVESLPEVLDDSSSLAEHSDSASVHDMDYVNPRGVRFTQSSQKEGER